MFGVPQSFTAFIQATRHDIEYCDCLDGIRDVFVSREVGVAVQFTSSVDSPKGWHVGRMRAEAKRIRAVEENHSLAIFRVHALDWDHRPEVIKHWLRHKLGESLRICSARQATLRCVPAALAKDFYNRFHLQGFVSGKHFGLEYGGQIVACITLTPHVPDRRGVAQKNSFELSRLALAGLIPGAASRLFRFAVDQVGANRVVTFSDNTYAQGAVYQKLGFVAHGEAKPEYRVWHPRYGTRHKAFWQRPAIPVRLRELELEQDLELTTDQRTEFEIASMAGCKVLWDLGRRRWLWSRSASDFVTRARYQARAARRGGQQGNNNAKKGRRKRVINIRLAVKRGGTSREYLLRRLARDHPDILLKWERGELPSARAAAIQAGIIKVAGNRRSWIGSRSE